MNELSNRLGIFKGVKRPKEAVKALPLESLNPRILEPFLPDLTRRQFIGTILGGLAGLYGTSLPGCARQMPDAETFIGKVKDYQSDITSVIFAGLSELKIGPDQLKGKSILLKPNLVESHTGQIHITTHPLVIRGTVEAFLKLGAKQVIVGEGPGNSRDSMRVIEEVGLREVLSEDQVPFVDLNYDDIYTVPNEGNHSPLKTLSLPATLRHVDWIVSMPKMKTHHLAGITVSMKNLFGVLPGIIYGWPKNVLHFAGINKCILDINTTVKPHFAIVDGIVGMEGDGPIMGTPCFAGVIVIGRNLPAVDGTCVRIMGYDPNKVPYLHTASKILGPIHENKILQRGETIRSVVTKFKLEEYIPAHKKLIG